jgi:coatomer protein complex subunit alpha (xenin)
LKELGQLPLAYLSATTHGLTEEAAQLSSELEQKNLLIPDTNPNAHPLDPPKPINPLVDNWPQLSVSSGPFDAQLLASAGPNIKSWTLL